MGTDSTNGDGKGASTREEETKLCRGRLRLDECIIIQNKMVNEADDKNK
jgi:hypothetical protein